MSDGGGITGALGVLGQSLTGKQSKKKSGGKKDSGDTKISDSMKSTPGFYGSEVTSYKKGGPVRKTGMAKLHAGERVLTRKQARKYRGGKG